MDFSMNIHVTHILMTKKCPVYQVSQSKVVMDALYY